jgi:uncharacterized protein with HEPN domain
MRWLEDTILLNDMLDYARRAMDAVKSRSREDLNTDAVLVGALERFVEVIGEAAHRLSESTPESAPEIPWSVVRKDLPQLITHLEKSVGDSQNS